jgi:hypothetical protein
MVYASAGRNRFQTRISFLSFLHTCHKSITGILKDSFLLSAVSIRARRLSADKASFDQAQINILHGGHRAGFCK